MQNQLFNIVSAKTSWLTQRHGVLAQNIANADTPSFEAKDLKKMDLDGLHRLAGNPTNRVRMTQTHPGHIQGRPMAPLGALRAQEADTFEIAPDGNSVVIEEQVSKMAENQMDYQLMTNVYRKHMDMARTALGRNG